MALNFALKCSVMIYVRKFSKSKTECRKKKLPGMHTQRNPPLSSRQVPSFLQGFESHSLILISHRGPVNPLVQLQWNDPGVFTQVPSCSQGDPLRKNEKHTMMYKTKD